MSIRTDHGREFDNEVQVRTFCDANGITYNFSDSRTPQSNRVVERKNRTLFDENPPPKSSPLVDDDIIEIQIIENQIEDIEVKENGLLNKEIVNIKESKDHPIEKVIINLNERTLRSQVQNQSNFFCFVSSIKPKNIKEAIKDKSWTMAMQEELNQFVTNDVWSLVPPPNNETIIGTKWVFKNKSDENGVVSQNKARLVAQGYNLQEGIDFDETYAPIFEMSMMGELNFFLGLQIKQLEDGMFFNQSKYIKEMLKKFGLEDSKPIKTPMSSETKLIWDEDGESVDDTKYRGMIGSLLYLTAH
ncbi:retrovirus-related pol polyprotein from transposon TNT 1-94 [Tanacetum coccineum]